MNPRLLLVGDFGSPTGFATVNTKIAYGLKERGWEVKVLGINYHGDPHPLQKDFHIYVASLGGDPFGMGRIADVAAANKPDAIFIANDSWNIKPYTEELKLRNLKMPVVAMIPVDAPNQKEAHRCNDLAHLICTTEFGLKAMRDSGYTKPGSVIPYGIDLALYQPMDKRQARIARGFPPALLDAFIVGRADRNSARKRYDLSTEYWADWWKGAGKPEDAYLYYHCATLDGGWDILQLAEYYGIGERVIVTARGMAPGIMVPQKQVHQIYNTWDVHLSTTLGEGWGLVGHESAACRVAQILPDYAAYGEWMKDGAFLVPCTGRSAGISAINTIGGIVDKAGVINALDYFHTCRHMWDHHGKQAFDVATHPRFNWDTVNAQIDAVLKGVL